MTDEPAAVQALYEQVSAALASHDKATAVRTAVEAVSSYAVTIAELYRDVLTRILTDTGEAWHRGDIAIWEEHMASATVRTIVEIVYPGVLRAKAEAAQVGRTVLLACPPEEGHDLGLRMVADRFDMAGWTTYYLGPDTPVQEIAAAARGLGADAVVMSSSTHFHRLAVRHAVDALKRELPDTDISVGGPAFVGAATGWLPEEIADLDALLGDAPAAEAPAEAESDFTWSEGSGAGAPPTESDSEDRPRGED
jgi:MerR family transcriptional regulator, light-induced transcriptional regulator